jgi:hypothetical protein
MTGNEMIDLVKDLINEEKEKVFPPERILRGLNLAKDMLVAFIHNLPGEWFMTDCTITTTSGTSKYQLPNGTLYAAATKCNGTVDFIVVNERVVWPCTDGEFKNFFNSSTSTWSSSPSSFHIYGDYLYTKYKPDAAVAMTLYYPFNPDTIVATAVEYEWLKGFETLLPLKAAVILKKQVNDDPASIESELNWHLNNLVGIGPRAQAYPQYISTGDSQDGESEFA